jgi:hypothetical protein
VVMQNQILMTVSRVVIIQKGYFKNVFFVFYSLGNVAIAKLCC